MTREEAVDLLGNLIGMVDDNHDSDYDSALRMAIEALSVIEDIKAEIAQVVEREKAEDAKWALGLRYSLKIIDKHISGKESE